MFLALPSTQEAHPLALNYYIRDYEVEFPEAAKPDAEFDRNKWRAFFRASAKYTVREVDRQAAAQREQQRLDRQRRRELQGRRTRPGDISGSDSDSDLGHMEDGRPAFDIMVVDRDKAVGKLLRKWLGAARTRIGGVFPKQEAAGDVAKYLQEARDLSRKRAERRAGLDTKDRKGKKSPTGKKPGSKDGAARSDPSSGFPQSVQVNAASAGLMQRWIQAARDRQFAATRAELDDHMDRLEDIVGPQLHEANDWYFGVGVRLQGEELVEEGRRLAQERQRGASEAEHKARRLLHEFDERRTEQQAKSRKEREEMRSAWEDEVR